MVADMTNPEASLAADLGIQSMDNIWEVTIGNVNPGRKVRIEEEIW